MLYLQQFFRLCRVVERENRFLFCRQPFHGM